MGISVAKMHKMLGELIEKGHGRRHICVDKATFTDNRESDGVTILDVYVLKPACIEMADDDGGLALNKDGTAKTRNIVLLGGCAAG